MELITRINEFLRTCLKVEYTGKMTYTVEPDSDLFYYELHFPLNPDLTRLPLILSGQFNNEDEFYNFIIKELKAKRIHLYENFRAYKLPLEDFNCAK